MKILGAVLVALIVLIQYPLWLGKGGWLRASQLDGDLQAQKEKNARLEARNASLAAEVRDLKQGTEAVEERARYELGLTRPDEQFYQYQDSVRP
jgi:cell division protein FtsB